MEYTFILTCSVALFYTWTVLAIGSIQKRHHDGRTVTQMLAEIGEGPGLQSNWSVTSKECENGTEGCDDEGLRSIRVLIMPDEGTKELCWGYEKKCNKEKRLFVPHCDEPSRPWSQTMEGKHEEFWNQGDFGYVKKELDTMMTLCKPIAKGDSMLKCSSNLRYCRTRNLYIDFRRFKETSQSEGRYKSFLEDIFKEGEVGGHCEFDKTLHSQQGEHKSPLQSWFAELEQYTQLDFRPANKKNCDETITKPTVFIKLDAGVNLYHHYCDFFNLYASQHINGTFSDDIYIVMWDTSYRPYFDLFSETWKAFSKYPIKQLSDFDGKRMCFKDAMFSLLARMRRGLYYNTYLLPGCHGSGLMQAFTKHLLARLEIHQEPIDTERVRVTLLSRSTKHRRIVNEAELISAMRTVGFFDVKVVDYKARVFPFMEQIQTSHNSDIFIGMHGSGLTHLVFLPDWAAAFELYNCEDPRCYHDLARLRGVQYITWGDGNKVWPEAEGKHPTLGTHHAKFTNYSFDVDEFMRLIVQLGEDVRGRKRESYSQLVQLNHNIHDEL